MDPNRERPEQPPRLPTSERPRIPGGGAIPSSSSAMPDDISHDASKNRLVVGQGYVENVTAAMWNREVSGKQVLLQWFSYRKRNRERPLIGDRRPPSPLGDIQPDHWLAEYTTELINLLNVLGLLIKLEPVQAEVLDKIRGGPLIAEDELLAKGIVRAQSEHGEKGSRGRGPGLFDEE